MIIVIGKLDLFRNSLMMSKCEEHTKHRAAAYMKYVRTRPLA
ncbi:hypothetical protein [Candidatus Sarmatiella mevalonica]|nr:hypothetical protein [Candidatus Sarmatiella mevalonica]